MGKTRHCWCEQAASPFESESQLVNTFTNVPHLALALYTLLALPEPPAMYAQCLGMMLLAIVGSILHHALPLLDWSYYTDIEPMLLLAGLYCLYLCASLGALTGSALARNAFLLVGLVVFASQSIATSKGYGESYTMTEGFTTTFGVNVVLHSLLWLKSSVPVARSDFFDVPENRTDLHRAYVLCGALLAVALACQRIEADGCPDWLSGSVGLHGVWHLCVYHVTYNSLGLLVVQNSAQDNSGVEWRTFSVPRWLVVVPFGLTAEPRMCVNIRTTFPALFLQREQEL